MSINIDGLSHVYMRGTPCEKIALRDITMDIQEGTSLGIAGCAGSGKTTLIQHLNGILRPSAGKISVNGLEVAGKNLRELRRRVGILFQHPEQQLFEETVFREVAFGLNGRSRNPLERERRVKEALSAVGVGDEFLDASPFTLSAGLRRRVAIAAVLASGPEVLVLDEPTAGLDPRGRREILDLMKLLHGRGGVTLILVSHNLDVIARICERVVVMKEGAVVMDGETRKVLCDVGALERAGLRAPPITTLMAKLKGWMPELDERLLTVEEARRELNRVLRGDWRRRSIGDERNDHGELLPRRLGDPQVGSQDENNHCGDLTDSRIRC